jgi:hypothetical protein
MATDAKMSQAKPVQRIVQQEEEKKGGLDARDLIARFRSKSDIYEYLSLHCKITPGY